MFTGAFRKTIGLFCVALGVGVALGILLPFWCWIAIVAIAVIVLGISWFFC
ncbi:MAG: 2-oxoglutarate translocator [Clostridia bacterium]